jgi:hypothetical protein
MTSKAEALASRSLRALLAPLEDGAPIPDSREYLELQSALEFLLPDLLAEEHAFWRHQELDGFRFERARRTSPCAAELVGHCILIDDQCWAPIYLRIRAAAQEDALEHVDCRIGEAGPGSGGIERIPFHSSRLTKHFYAFVDRADTVPWVYRCVRTTPARP